MVFFSPSVRCSSPEGGNPNKGERRRSGVAALFAMQGIDKMSRHVESAVNEGAFFVGDLRLVDGGFDLINPAAITVFQIREV
jgi:hypothetical protein